MKFTHTGDDGLTGFTVTVDRKGRVFFRQRCKCIEQFIAVSRCFRFDRNGDNRIREGHGFQSDRITFCTDRITGRAVTQTNYCGNITAIDAIAFFTVVSMHLEQTADTFSSARTRVQNRCTFFCHTGINTDKCKFTNKRVCHQFENQCRERLFITATANHRLFSIRIHTFGFPNINRRREVIADSIKEKLNPFVLECSTAECGNEFTGKNTFTERTLHKCFIRHFSIQIHFHDLIIDFSKTFDQVCVIFFCFFFVFVRNVDFFQFRSFRTFIQIGFLFDDMNVAFEISFCTHGEGNRNNCDTEFLAHILYDFVEVCAGTVHLVHKSHGRHFVFSCLTPNCFRLRLNTADRTKHTNCTVENAQRAFHFSSKVHVSWGVNQIDTVIFPEACCSSGSNGNTTFLFLLHPVHGSCTIVHFTDLMAFASVEKDTFRKCGLTGVNVRHNTDVTGICKSCNTTRSFLVILINNFLCTHSQLYPSKGYHL